LISVALRLQVAIKVSQEDDITMNSLISQAESAKAREIAANRKVEEATEIINSLSIEVNSLKRKLKAFEEKAPGQGNSVMQNFQYINDVADTEVDQLLTSEVRNAIPNYIDPLVAKAATPFDRWKMNEFLYAPNTPAGSRSHDKHAVHMLLQAATAEMAAARIDRPTKTSITRTRKILASQSPPRSLQETADSSAFFLNSSNPKESWRIKPSFERDNLGRINLWSTLDPPPTTNNNNNSGMKLSQSHGSPVYREKTNRPGSSSSGGGGGGGQIKLKSLRLPAQQQQHEQLKQGKRSPSPVSLKKKVLI
jgi:hypothetical protein